MKLKIIVDTKANKVVFAEAGKEFVDFLAQIMALPLSSVSKLLDKKGMLGCQGTLYNSMASLDSGLYETEFKKDLLLRPLAFVKVPLLSLNVAPAASIKISRHYSTLSPLQDDTGYVKEKVPYIVMDNLEVKPMTMSVIKSFFKDHDSLDEQEVEVGEDEGLAILKASLERQDVLTSVFLQIKVE